MSEKDAKTIKLLLGLIFIVLVLGREQFVTATNTSVAIILAVGATVAAAWIMWHVGKFFLVSLKFLVSLPKETLEDTKVAITKLRMVRREGQPWFSQATWLSEAILLAGVPFAFIGVAGLVAISLGAPRWIAFYTLLAMYVGGGLFLFGLGISAVGSLCLHRRKIVSKIGGFFGAWGFKIIAPFTMPMKLIDYYRWQISVGQFRGYAYAAGDFALSMFYTTVIAIVCLLPILFGVAIAGILIVETM